MNNKYEETGNGNIGNGKIGNGNIGNGNIGSGIAHDISYPSLCIPRLSSNITRAQIFKIFSSLNLGILERVDIVPVGNGGFQRVFVHFKSWNNSSLEVCKIRERILSGKDIKVIYDGPFIWKVSLNRASIHK